MASNQFEYVDESSIDENYKCNICNEPFFVPVTTSCDHTYCHNCLDLWLNEGHASCPTCRHQLSTHDIKPVTTRLVLNILDRIQVKCSRCQQTGIQRGNFSDHMSKICPKALVNCPASDVQCPWSGVRDQLSTHLSACNYEPLRPMLKNLIETNEKLEKQVQSLTNQVEMMIAGVETSTLRLISFDKLSLIDRKIESGIIFSIYEDFKWINTWYMHEQWVKTNHPFSGWKNAFNNSRTCVAFNGQGNAMKICTKQQGKETFSLISFESTAAWHDDLEVQLIGRFSKDEIYSTTILLQFDTSKTFQVNWNDIDEIEFIPLRGKCHPGTEYTEKYFAITWILIK